MPNILSLTHLFILSFFHLLTVSLCLGTLLSPEPTAVHKSIQISAAKDLSEKEGSAHLLKKTNRKGHLHEGSLLVVYVLWVWTNVA